MAKRVAKWDNVKFLLIFLVVLGHITEASGQGNSVRSMTFFIYLFHMPAFIFLSGLFSKKIIEEKKYNVIFSYLLLYVFMKIFFFLANSLIDRQVAVFTLFIEGAVPWYAFAIFVFQLISIVAIRFNRKYVYGFSLLLACIIGYDSRISDFLVLSRIFVFFPFFLFGYYTDEKRLRRYSSNKIIRGAAIVLLLSVVLLVFLNIENIFYMKPLLTGRNPYAVITGLTLKYGMFYRAIWYVIALVVGGSVLMLVPNKKLPVITVLGKRTLQIYFMHIPINWLLTKKFNVEEILENFLGAKWLAFMVYAVIITLLSSFTIYGEIINKLIYPKKNKDIEKNQQIKKRRKTTVVS